MCSWLRRLNIEKWEDVGDMRYWAIKLFKPLVQNIPLCINIKRENTFNLIYHVERESIKWHARKKLTKKFVCEEWRPLGLPSLYICHGMFSTSSSQTKWRCNCSRHPFLSTNPPVHRDSQLWEITVAKRFDLQSALQTTQI